MTLQDYLVIFRKNWVVIVICTLVAAGLSVAWTLTRTPTYEATTQLYVSVRTADSSSSDLYQGSNYAQQAVASYVDVVTTSVVLDEVISELGLDLTAAELADEINASTPTNTVLINITVSDSDPSQSALIANTVGSVFIDLVENQLEKPADNSPARVQIDTVEPAIAPISPASPSMPKNIALGLICGVAIGIGIAVLREVLDTRIRSKSDLRAITDIAVIGTTIFNPDSAEHPLIAQAEPQSPSAEAYRSLRTNLQFLSAENPKKSFVFTSSSPYEGKSTTAANLAIVLADAGHRVALIDADLRKPRVAALLGVEGAVGLTDLLIGKVTYDEVLLKTGRKQLFVLPAGRIPPNPSELLGSVAMDHVIETLSSHFDYVIIDAPPILVATDAAVVGKKAGGVLLLAASGKTHRPELVSALEALSNVGCDVRGIIMTMVPTSGPDSYRYSRTYYRASSDEAPKGSGHLNGEPIMGAVNS